MVKIPKEIKNIYTPGFGRHKNKRRNDELNIYSSCVSLYRIIERDPLRTFVYIGQFNTLYAGITRLNRRLKQYKDDYQDYDKNLVLLGRKVAIKATNYLVDKKFQLTLLKIPKC